MSDDARPDFIDLWNFGDPAGTEARFREILPRARESGDVSYLAQRETQIARTQGLQRRFDDAHATLDEVEARIAGRDDLPAARVRYLLERGRAFDSPAHPPEEKRRDEARALFTEAFEYGREKGLDRLALDAAHMLGIVEPPGIALEWNLRSIELAEASADEGARGWLGPLYNNTGWTYHDQGRYPEALVLFERSLAWRTSRGEAAEIRIARWCVARCLRSLGRVDEALERQRALLADYEAVGVEEKGYVSEELGECLHALGREDEARGWFARAHERLSKNEAWLLSDQPERMARLERLAD